MNLTDEQRSIFDSIERGENLLITGVAGTGKSFLIEEIKKLEPKNYFGAIVKPDITATTGIAALNIGGVTIHSWASLGIGQQEADDIAHKIKNAPFCREIKEKINRCKILVIDEISMLSDKMLNLLDAVLKGVREDYRPFGSIQVIFVGDFLQLPPVVKDEKRDRHEEPEQGMLIRDVAKETFCFKAQAWHEANIKTIMLTKVFRQENEQFSACLRNVRLGQMSDDDISLLKTRQDITPSGVFPICIFPTNKQAEILNQGQLNKLESRLEIFDAIEQTLIPEIAENQKKINFHRAGIDRDCLAPKSLHLKVGAQVMLLKNLSFQTGLVNGSMGQVIGFSSVDEELENDDPSPWMNEKKQSITYRAPIVKFMNGITRTLERAEWVKKEGTQEIIKRIQFPLRLAWAITSHKAQGMTLDAVYCDLSNVFEAGQGYVSLSRVKTLEGLYLKGFNPAKIRANKEAVAFYEQFNQEKKPCRIF